MNILKNFLVVLLLSAAASSGHAQGAAPNGDLGSAPGGSASAPGQPVGGTLVDTRLEAEVAPPAPELGSAPPAPATLVPAPIVHDRSAVDSTQSVPAPTGPRVAVTPGRGLTVTSEDGSYAINLRARMQLRGAVTTHRERDTELEASVRTLRFFVTGHVLSPDLKYLIQLALAANDFERDNASPIFDAFIEYTALRDLNVRVGQYFVPFDRARTIREFALQLVDRQAVVRELSLDRDFGLMFSSPDLFGLGGRLGYNVFFGSGDGRNRVLDARNVNGPQKPGVLLVGRLAVRPFGQFDDDQEGDLTRSDKPRLSLGVAGAYNIASNRDKSTYGATYTAGTFDYTHAAADLVLKYYGFSLLTEFLYRHADHRANTGPGASPMAMPITERSRSGYGYFVQAGQMLTSKLEVAARWEELFAADDTDPALRDGAKLNGRQVGGGLNLYLNGHLFKLQSDYFHVFGVRDGRESHVARIQLDASF